MGLVAWIIVGLVAGVIAKAIHRGDEPGGWLGTLATGVVGAVVGGLIASALGIGDIGPFFSLATWIVALAGALLLLAIYGAMSDSRPRSSAAAR